MSDSIEHSERAHALLSASGATRWLSCTPSPRLEEENETTSNSSFAEEGTLAHEFADLGLQKASKAITVGKYNRLCAPLLENKYYSEEMDEHVATYVNYVMQQFKVAKKVTKDAILSIEEQMDLSHLIREGFGTNDCVIIADKTLEVIDLKYGKGIPVSAENNPQLRIYGLGALYNYLLMYDIETVKMTIVQPRLDSISTEEMSVEDLIEWGDKVVRPKAELAFEGKGEQVPGAHCRWCKVKAKCRALAEYGQEAAKHDFAEPMLLSDEELLEIYTKIKLINEWTNSISAHILQEAKNGKKWEGLKLVEGRSNRKWVDEKSAIEILTSEGHKQEQFINSKLQGIGKIEKLVGKTFFADRLGSCVAKPPGAPTLAHEMDKRPAFGIEQAKQDFA